MQITKVTVTPAIAKQWLGFNLEHNRPLRETRIAQYAHDMENDRWVVGNGDTIRFDTNDRLVDGQHRLCALIRSGKTLEMDVAYGVPIAAITVIDTGATRTFADSLTFEGATERNRAGAIVRRVVLYRAGMPTGKGATYRPSPAELIEEYRKDHAGYDASSFRSRDIHRRLIGNGSAAGTAHYLFKEVNKDATEAFFDSLVTGANIGLTHPILVLRNRLLIASKQRLTPGEQLAMYFRAWKYYCTDTPITQITAIGTDKLKLNNDNFPELWGKK